MANSEDPDEMQHNAAFHQGLHCLLTSLGTEMHHSLEILPVTPLSTKWTVPYLLYQYVWENLLDYKGLKLVTEVQISFQFNWLFTPLAFYIIFFFKTNCLKIFFYPTYIFEIAYL